MPPLPHLPPPLSSSCGCGHVSPDSSSKFWCGRKGWGVLEHPTYIYIGRVTSSLVYNDQGGLRKKQRKNKVISQRKDFAKHKENIPPAVSSNVKWSGARLALTLEGGKWEVGRGVISRRWSGWGEERADGRCAFPLVLLSYPRKVRNGNCERRCEVKLIWRNQAEVAEGGIPFISAQGYNNIKSVDLII